MAVQDITCAQIRELDASFRPNAEEVAGMVEAMCRRKKWNRGYFCSLLGITELKLRIYEKGKKAIPVEFARLIWLFHTIDTQPELATNAAHIASWGRAEQVIPKPARQRNGLTQEEHDTIKAMLDKRGNKRHLSLTDFRSFIEPVTGMVDITAARRYAKTLSYRLSDGRKSPKKRWKGKFPRMFRADGMWMNVNWNWKNAQIAAHTACSENYVVSVRIALRAFKPAVLKRHIIECGKDPAMFTRIFRVTKMGRPGHVKDPISKIRQREYALAETRRLSQIRHRQKKLAKLAGDNILPANGNSEPATELGVDCGGAFEAVPSTSSGPMAE